jgi:hypothetical protein
LLELTKSEKGQMLRLKRKKGEPESITEIILRPKTPANVHQINSAKAFHI